MYKLIEQTVTEARQSFTKTLRELAGDDEKETVVLVRKRGEPVAGIISYRELARYAQWRVDQIRRHAGESGQLSEQAIPENDAGELPKGWPTPEKYARRWIADGCSQERTVEGLVENYGPHGVTLEDAERIVESVLGNHELGQ